MQHTKVNLNHFIHNIKYQVSNRTTLRLTSLASSSLLAAKVYTLVFGLSLLLQTDPYNTKGKKKILSEKINGREKNAIHKQLWC